MQGLHKNISDIYQRYIYHDKYYDIFVGKYHDIYDIYITVIFTMSECLDIKN